MGARQGQGGGRRWELRERRGVSCSEAGKQGGRSHRWQPPRALSERQEAALRWAMGEATQSALAAEYGVSRTTLRRWCAALVEREED